MRRAAIVLLVLALSGCARTVEEPASSPLPVTVTRSGGIAGLNDKIVVDEHGGWRHIGRNSGGSGTLTADQLDRLTRMAEKFARSDGSDRPSTSTGCADGFDYAVTVGSTMTRWQDCGGTDGPPSTAQEIARSVLDFTS